MAFRPKLYIDEKDIVIRYVYDEHPIAGQDIQYQAPDNRSRYTKPFDKIIK